MQILKWIGWGFSKLISMIFLGLIYLYKVGISPFTPSSCRHVPTCSQYAFEAVKYQGPLRGTWMAIRRLSKCHPWGTHGYDPVPHIRFKQYQPEATAASEELMK